MATNKEGQFEIVIMGGTPGGIATAITSARLGHQVALIEPHHHLGGMTTSGLGKSDVEQKEFIGGLFKEFTQKVYEFYKNTYGEESNNAKLCREGYYFEPSVAENILMEMIEETGKITTFKGYYLKEAKVKGSELVGISIVKKATDELYAIGGKIFIDATYEGDLFALSGAPYRLGRESRNEFNEPHAGVIYFDFDKGVVLAGSTGAADDGLPAYTYRYCLTTDIRNSRIMEKEPDNYDRSLYTPYFDDLKSGRLSAPTIFHEGWGYYPEHFDTMVRALSITNLPNSKVDGNTNPRPLAFPYPEENKGYIEGDQETRNRICDRHRDIALGLIWFLQNDPEIPEEHRKMALRYHLPLDEFTDNDNFPFQLYVREGRRLKGVYTLTEHDVAITEYSPDFFSHHDTIAMGEFPIDSFPVHKKASEDKVVLEGYLGMLAHLTRPYEIPYRAMIPEKIDGLIVPVALSATHVAFCSIRMEPTWMSLGQAAGVAAHVCLKYNDVPRNVNISEVRNLLKKQGQVLKNELLPSDNQQ